MVNASPLCTTQFYSSSDNFKKVEINVNEWIWALALSFACVCVSLSPSLSLLKHQFKVFLLSISVLDLNHVSGLYYINYSLQNPGEARRYLYSAIGMASNGWYNRLYTVTGQVCPPPFIVVAQTILKGVSVITQPIWGTQIYYDYYFIHCLPVVCGRRRQQVRSPNSKGELIFSLPLYIYIYFANSLSLSIYIVYIWYSRLIWIIGESRFWFYVLKPNNHLLLAGSRIISVYMMIFRGNDGRYRKWITYTIPFYVIFFLSITC